MAAQRFLDNCQRNQPPALAGAARRWPGQRQIGLGILEYTSFARISTIDRQLFAHTAYAVFNQIYQTLH
jgi:hypothetical protein